MVYILLGAGFEEAEALIPADVLRRGGLPVALCGIGGPTVTGGHGITVAADQPVECVMLAPGDTLVVPGGTGGVDTIGKSVLAAALIRQAAAMEAVTLAAICAAPALLGRMGLLRGRRAVCYPGLEGDLLANGAKFVDSPVVLDGNLVTGRSAGAAFPFALTLLELLSGVEKADQVRAGLVYRP